MAITIQDIAAAPVDQILTVMRRIITPENYANYRFMFDTISLDISQEQSAFFHDKIGENKCRQQ